MRFLRKELPGHEQIESTGKQRKEWVSERDPIHARPIPVPGPQPALVCAHASTKLRAPPRLPHQSRNDRNVSVATDRVRRHLARMLPARRQLRRGGHGDREDRANAGPSKVLVSRATFTNVMSPRRSSARHREDDQHVPANEHAHQPNDEEGGAQSERSYWRSVPSGAPAHSRLPIFTGCTLRIVDHDQRAPPAGGR